MHTRKMAKLGFELGTSWVGNECSTIAPHIHWQMFSENSHLDPTSRRKYVTDHLSWGQSAWNTAGNLEHSGTLTLERLRGGWLPPHIFYFLGHFFIFAFYTPTPNIFIFLLLLWFVKVWYPYRYGKLFNPQGPGGGPKIKIAIVAQKKPLVYNLLS